jgi:tetratricopeptide (TPR) repeat protein
MSGGSQVLERAVQARAEGRLEDARRLLDEALARAADSRLLSLRADVLSDMGCVVEALADLGSLMAEEGQSAELLCRRAQFHLQRRNYPEALADLDEAVRTAPGEPRLRLKRAEAFSLFDRLDDAQADLDEAVRLMPGDADLRLARLRMLVLRGETAAASKEIAALLRAGPRAAAEARFLRGCVDFKLRRRRCGEGDFKALVKALPETDPLSMRARFYWIASRAADPAFRKRQGMKTPKKERSPKLFLCGLGIFPPYTTSLEVLHALSRCDVVFNNVAGPEVRGLLAEFCARVRPASYQAWQDEPKWADSIFQELAKGHKVGFVTRGHPLVFGGLAVELIRRCREGGTPFETFGAVSSIDHILAYTGSGLGDDFKGLQAVDRPALESAENVNTRLPLLVCFYGGVEKKAEVAAFRRSLERFYPSAHGCWMFGPKYDAVPRTLAVGELESRFPEIHSSLMLYVPPLS